MTIAGGIGPVDAYSAVVAVAFAAGLTIMVTVMVARYQGSTKTRQDFELEKLRLQNSNAESARNAEVRREVELGKIAANRQVEMTRIEHGGIEAQVVRETGTSGGDG